MWCQDLVWSKKSCGCVLDREEIKAWMRASAAGRVRESPISAMLQRWWKEDLTIWRMWGSGERVGSKVNTKVASLGGRGDSGAINDECGFVDSAEGGITNTRVRLYNN